MSGNISDLISNTCTSLDLSSSACCNKFARSIFAHSYIWNVLSRDAMSVLFQMMARTLFKSGCGSRIRPLLKRYWYMMPAMFGYTYSENTIRKRIKVFFCNFRYFESVKRWAQLAKWNLGPHRLTPHTPTFVKQHYFGVRGPLWNSVRRTLNMQLPHYSPATILYRFSAIFMWRKPESNLPESIQIHVFSLVQNSV